MAKDVLIKRWGEESVIYQTASSDLYHLDPFRTSVLTQLQPSALTLKELADQLSQAYQVDSVDLLNQQLQATLIQFIGSDLVEFKEC